MIGDTANQHCTEEKIFHDLISIKIDSVDLDIDNFSISLKPQKTTVRMMREYGIENIIESII